jgi:hypothetical protein
MKTCKAWLKALLFLAILLLMTMSPSAHAAGPWYVATDGNDSNDCLSPGSANACASITGALGKADPGDTIYVALGTYTGSSTEVLMVNKDVTLSGGWDPTFSSQSGMSILDGEDARRVIKVNSSVIAILERLIIRNGRYDGAPGIFNEGELWLIDSTVTSNIDIGDWTSEGGGIRSSQDLIIYNTTIDGNTSSSGAGIFNAWGTVTLNNSTVSGNVASGGGGGINNLGGDLFINSSTISQNMDIDAAGGIHNEAGGSVTLENSLLAGNSGGHGKDCNGNIGSAGYNLIGDTTNCTYTLSTGDLTDVDPRIWTLQDYGGSTQTHALLFTSPAINSGNPAGCLDAYGFPLPTDQRGLTRLLECDIGAFEHQNNITVIPYSDNFNDNMLDISYWAPIEDEGVVVEETGMEILVSGSSTDSSWEKNGLRTANFPKQSFQTSVNYKLVNMTSNPQMTNLRLYFENGAHYFSVGYDDFDGMYRVVYRDATGYNIISSIPQFGDEGTVFHLLRIVFNAATNTASGYVDDVLIASLTSDIFSTPMYLQFHQESNIAGDFNVDCRFDNYSLSDYREVYLPLIGR